MLREPTPDEMQERIQIGLEGRGPGSDSGPPNFAWAWIGDLTQDDMRVLMDWAFDPWLRLVND